MPIEAGSQVGTAQEALKRVHQAFMRLYRSLQCKVGSSLTNLETINFRLGTTLMGNSAELFTGDKRVQLPTTYDREGLLYIVADQPLPFAVNAVIFDGQEYD